MTQVKHTVPTTTSDLLGDETKGVAVAIDFGTLGNSADYKLAGWQEPESGFTWTLGGHSSLMFHRPELPGRYELHIHLSPFIWKDRITAQRMSVAINDEQVGSFAIDHEQVVCCELPWAALARRPVCIIDFDLPDSAAPAEVNGVPDTRSIAFAFRQVRLTWLEDGQNQLLGERAEVAASAANLPLGSEALTKLMMRFESLGEDCEFGLVQRRCGAEPLGLLRFASSPLPKLIAAMKAKFEGLGRPDTLKVELAPSGREYMVLDQCFGLYYHAWVMAGEKSPEEVHARECNRLPFLVRKLMEDLREGEKIFVYRGMKALDEKHVLKLAETMRTFGPTTLLWIEVADAEHDAGSVEEVAAGLWRGNIKHFAPANNAHDFNLKAWIDVCCTADGFGRTLKTFLGSDKSN